MRRLLAPTILAVALVAGACSDDEEGVTADGTASATASPSATSSEAPAAAGFTPVSDVSSHAAIGTDVAAIKAQLDQAKQDKPVDWAAVRTTFTTGGASVKGDGSIRTLEKLVDAPDVVAFVLAAIAGTGDSAGAPDVVRAQRVDKGISALLDAKVRDELAAAAEKVEKGELDPATGAPHNVDEAWAFFNANGNGLESTAEKRAADFQREGAVAEPVLAALSSAQTAAKAGDGDALEAAIQDVGHALDYVFYLATHKYLDTEGSDTRRAEGLSFYLAIRPTVREADPAADTAITTAFASGDATMGRAALHSPGVLAALGIGADERVDEERSG